MIEDVHRHFELLLGLCIEPRSASRWNPMWHDNIEFLVWEHFVVTSAMLAEGDEWDSLGVLLGHLYAVQDRYSEMGYRTFATFESHQGSLGQVRNRRLALKRASVTADMLRERSEQGGPGFDALIDVELLLFVRSVLDAFQENAPEELQSLWRPRTFVYRGNNPRWGIRPRLKSRRFFQKMRASLGVSDVAELTERVAALHTPDRRVFEVGFTSLGTRSVGGLLGINEIASIP